jgi:hypothetical protein
VLLYGIDISVGTAMLGWGTDVCNVIVN